MTNNHCYCRASACIIPRRRLTMKRSSLKTALGCIVSGLLLRCALCFQTTVAPRWCSNVRNDRGSSSSAFAVLRHSRLPRIPVIRADAVSVRAFHGNDTTGSSSSEVLDSGDDESKDSSFLRNIKSNLVFPLNMPPLLARPRRAPASPSSKLASAFRSLRSFIVFPLRWVRKRLRRGRQSEGVVPPLVEEAVQTTSTTPTSVSIEDEVPVVTRGPQTAISSEEPKKPSPVKVRGGRWAVASVDLTGKWEIVVSDEFKQQYDRYLTLLGQPMLVRSVALSIVGLTTEETIQKDKGRELFVRGRNVRGVWERSLVASGADDKNPDFQPILTRIVTADAEEVTSEAWWEDNGRVHVSWLRGVQKYGGGDFESRRYLDGGVLVCESTFHPVDENREKACVSWRFKRQAK